MFCFRKAKGAEKLQAAKTKAAVKTRKSDLKAFLKRANYLTLSRAKKSKMVIFRFISLTTTIDKVVLMCMCMDVSCVDIRTALRRTQPCFQS